jgi:CPA2 family monovalent cation:H+ antiporter-2
MHGFFNELVIILTASALVLGLFYRLRLPPTLGYLTTGALIGPGALGLIGNQEAVQVVAEFGVVFLLFSLGLEFSLSRLVAMRRLVFGLGGWRCRPPPW